MRFGKYQQRSNWDSQGRSMPVSGKSSHVTHVYLAFGKATSARDAVNARQFWQSLPQASKLLILLIVLETCSWVLNVATAADPSKTCNGRPGCTLEHWEVSITTLLAQLSYAYLALDAIHEENAFQLVTSTGLSVVAALLWVLFAAILQLPSLAWSLGLTLGFAVVTVVNAWLTYLTYQQFGWRVHSKLACDLRRKHAAEKRHLYFVVNRFKTLLRLSCHAVFINAANGLIMALATKHAAAGLDMSGMAVLLDGTNPAVKGLLISVALYLLPLAWLTVTYLAVRYSNSSLELACTVSMAPLLALPAVPVYWVFSPTYLWPEHLAARVLLVAVPLAAWMILHVATWFSMRDVLRHFRSSNILELVAAAVDDVADLHQSVPEQLQPMLKGAWLLKAQYSGTSSRAGRCKTSRKTVQQLSNSAWHSLRAKSSSHTSDASSWLQTCFNRIKSLWQAVISAVCCSSKRWRFFQLSADLTTLRWAWNKYILLYFVDSLTVDADRLTITLHMMLDPDLNLVFEDFKLFDQWESALRLLLHMVTGTAPGSIKAVTFPAGQISRHTPDQVDNYSCSNGSIPVLRQESTPSSREPAGHMDASFVSQHSLVMTALQVQHGFRNKHGSTAVCDGSGGPCVTMSKTRGVSGRSLLQASRRSSINDPHALRLSQAQAVVDSISRQLSSSPDPHATATTLSKPGTPQQHHPFQLHEPAKDISPERLQPEHLAWLQHSSESPRPVSATALSSCATPTAEVHGHVRHMGTAADSLAQQLQLSPHQLLTHLQQQQQQPPDVMQQHLATLHSRQQPSASADTKGSPVLNRRQQELSRMPCVSGASFGPFRTPEGLLKQLQGGNQQHPCSRQHLSTSSEEDSAAAAGAKMPHATLLSSSSDHTSTSHAGTTPDHQQRNRHQGSFDDDNFRWDNAATRGGVASSSSKPLQQSSEAIQGFVSPMIQQSQSRLRRNAPGPSSYSPCSSLDPGAGLKSALPQRAHIPLECFAAGTAVAGDSRAADPHSRQQYQSDNAEHCFPEGGDSQQQVHSVMPLRQFYEQQYSQPPTPNTFGVYTSAALNRRAESPVANAEAAGVQMLRSNSMPAAIHSWSKARLLDVGRPTCQHHNAHTPSTRCMVAASPTTPGQENLEAASVPHIYCKTWPCNGSTVMMGGSLESSKDCHRMAGGFFVTPAAEDRVSRSGIIPAVWDHAVYQPLCPAAAAAGPLTSRHWTDWVEPQAVPQLSAACAELLSNKASAGGSVQQLDSPGRSQCTCESSGALPAVELAPCQIPDSFEDSGLNALPAGVSNAAPYSMGLRMDHLAQGTAEQWMEPTQQQDLEEASNDESRSLHLHIQVGSCPSPRTAPLQAPADSSRVCPSLPLDYLQTTSAACQRGAEEVFAVLAAHEQNGNSLMSIMESVRVNGSAQSTDSEHAESMSAVVVSRGTDGSFFTAADGNQTNKRQSSSGESTWRAGLHSLVNSIALMISRRGPLHGDAKQPAVTAAYGSQHRTQQLAASRSGRHVSVSTDAEAAGPSGSNDDLSLSAHGHLGPMYKPGGLISRSTYNRRSSFADRSGRASNTDSLLFNSRRASGMSFRRTGTFGWSDWGRSTLSFTDIESTTSADSLEASLVDPVAAALPRLQAVCGAIDSRHAGDFTLSQTAKLGCQSPSAAGCAPAPAADVPSEHVADSAELQSSCSVEVSRQGSRVDMQVRERLLQLTPPQSLPSSSASSGHNTAAVSAQNSFKRGGHHNEHGSDGGEAPLPQQRTASRQQHSAAVQSVEQDQVEASLVLGSVEGNAQQVSGRVPPPHHGSLLPLPVLPEAPASAELESVDAMDIPAEQPQQQAQYSCCTSTEFTAAEPAPASRPELTGAHVATAEGDADRGQQEHQGRSDELKRCSVHSFTFDAGQTENKQQQQRSDAEVSQPITLQTAYQLAQRDKADLSESSGPVEQLWHPWLETTKAPVSPNHCSTHSQRYATSSCSNSPRIGPARPAALRVSISDATAMTALSVYPVADSADITLTRNAAPPVGSAMKSYASLDSPKGIAGLQVRVPTAGSVVPGQSATGWPFAQYPPYQGNLGLAQHVPAYQQHLVFNHLPNADEGNAVNTPGSLASFNSHMSAFTDLSPRTGRTQRHSLASAGYGGSMQFNGSTGMSQNWSAHSGGSKFSWSTFRRGVSPQVSVELIEWRSLQLGRKIGRGAEGCVYEARYQDAPVAIKEAPGMNEIEMYLALGVHDNLVGLRGLTQKEDGTWCLLLEYCGRGTLDTLLHHSRSPLPRAAHHGNSGSNRNSSSGGKTAAAEATKSAEPAAGQQQQQDRQDLVKLLPLLRGIARGLLHLHTRRPAILHRDIKPANIFIGHGMVMKLGDFGMSRHVYSHDTAGGAVGTSAVSRRGSAVAAGSGSEHGGKRISIAGTRKSSGNGGISAQHHGVQQAATKLPTRTLTPGVVGTISYSAPEVLDEQYQAPDANAERILKADVYSLGVTIWEMVERKRPFEGMDGMQICALWIADPERMTLPPLTVGATASDRDQQVLVGLQELVSDCTAFHPDARPSISQVLGRIRHIQRLFDPKLAATDTLRSSKGEPKRQLGGSDGQDALLGNHAGTCVQVSQEQQQRSGSSSAVNEMHAAGPEWQHRKGPPAPGVTDPAVAAAIAAAVGYAGPANRASGECRADATFNAQGTTVPQQEEAVVRCLGLAAEAIDSSAATGKRKSKSDGGGAGRSSKVQWPDSSGQVGESMLLHSSSMPSVPCTVLPAVQHVSLEANRRISGAGLHHRHVR